MPLLTRRQAIKTGLAGAALLAITDCARSTAARAVTPFDDPSYRYVILTAADRTMIASIASAMLAGALPAAPAEHGAALVQAVRGVDVALAGLSDSIVAEVRQLFGLLEFGPTRALAAGIWSSWENASEKDVWSFLERWRFSSVTLFQTGYQALHQLVMASWYGNNASWARIGYPGPPPIS
jgi:hypothetical protein